MMNVFVLQFQVTYQLCSDKSHTQRTLCHKLLDELGKQCQKKTTLNCPLKPQHKFVANCCERLTARCPIVCNAKLPCGHFCSGTCSSCADNGKHQLCRAACRRRLPCNHQCSVSICLQPAYFHAWYALHLHGQLISAYLIKS
jgi:hypothetical protein